MNAQRLVSAVAGLGIGFGVIIASLGFVDDGQTAPIPSATAPDGQSDGAREETEDTGDMGDSEDLGDAEDMGDSEDTVDADPSDGSGNPAEPEPAPAPAPVEECVVVDEIITGDGRVLVAEEGLFPEVSGEVLVPSSDIVLSDVSFVVEVIRRDVVQAGDVFVDCETNEEVRDVEGASVLADLRELAASADDGSDVDDVGSSEASSDTETDRSSAPCGLSLADRTNALFGEFEAGQDPDGRRPGGQNSADSTTTFDEYLELVATLLAQRSASQPDGGWTANLADVTTGQGFADLDCEAFEVSFSVVQNQFFSVDDRSDVRGAFDSAICLFGQLSTEQESAQQLTNTVFDLFDRVPSSPACQIDPDLIEMEN